ncbi:hypothetical protein WN51_10995 [Melipona quadrifasciata]|uniref:Uncharacterized protein n=1 Tax=Melipona quadrifasciata TaxID=166423 RepID=A0A0M9A7Q3_9HYME|nr:hypothetical protein WN51_10995 [Melipona quadrifasciata]
MPREFSIQATVGRGPSRGVRRILVKGRRSDARCSLLGWVRLDQVRFRFQLELFSFRLDQVRFRFQLELFSFRLGQIVPPFISLAPMEFANFIPNRDTARSGESESESELSNVALLGVPFLCCGLSYEERALLVGTERSKFESLDGWKLIGEGIHSRVLRKRAPIDDDVLGERILHIVRANTRNFDNECPMSKNPKKTHSQSMYEKMRVAQVKTFAICMILWENNNTILNPRVTPCYSNFHFFYPILSEYFVKWTKHQQKSIDNIFVRWFKSIFGKNSFSEVEIRSICNLLWVIGIAKQKKQNEFKELENQKEGLTHEGQKATENFILINTRTKTEIKILLLYSLASRDQSASNNGIVPTNSEEKESDELCTVRSLVMVRKPVASARGCIQVFRAQGRKRRSSSTFQQLTYLVCATSPGPLEISDLRYPLTESLLY